MDYHRFESVMKHIKKHHEDTSVVYKIFGGCELGDTIEDDLVSLLEEYLDDNDELVYWWIYETDFGNKNTEVVINGKSMHIKTTSELWDVLHKKT